MATNPRKTPPVLTKKHQDRLHREQRQTRLILWGTLVVIGLTLLIVGYGILEQQVIRYKRAVAVVNGERISAEDYRAYTKYYRQNIIRSAEQTYQFASMFGSDPTMMQNFAAQLQSAKTALEPYNAAETALNALVDNTLMIQEAQKRGIQVSDEEVETELQHLLGYFANGTPTPTNTLPPVATSTLSALQQGMLQPTATQTPTTTLTTTATAILTGTETVDATATLTPAAAPTEAPTPSGPTAVPATPTTTPSPTPFTFEGYQNMYATVVAEYATDFEVPEETLRYAVQVQLYQQKMTAEVIGDVACTQEQVWAQHILTPDPAMAVVVKEKLDAGEDWYALAAEYSTDESSQATGGDLGWFPKEQMVTEFSEAAFALEVGEVSEPVQSQFGYHIIRVLGHEDRPLTANECEMMKESRFKTWLDELRASSQVELLPHWETIYPLLPTLPAEINQVIEQLSSQGIQPQVPVGIPTP